MTNTNNKIRAVVLAALMVLSVFAGTIAFTGAASAEVTDAGNTAPATVYLGDEDIDVSNVPGITTSLVGIAGDADGTTASINDLQNADITETNGFVEGGYSDSDDGDTILSVREPQISDLTIETPNGADVTDGTVTNDQTELNITAEWNFARYENVTITVEDEDGLEVQSQLGNDLEITDSDDVATLTGVDDLDAGEYTVTVEGEEDLDGTTRSATFTIRDEENTITLSESTVTQGDSVVATVTGEPGEQVHVRIDQDDLEDSYSDPGDVFATTGDVDVGPANFTDDEGTDWVAVVLGLGDDGEANTRIETGSIDTGTVDIELAQGADINNTDEDTAELTVEEQSINITSSPSVVRIGEDFDIEGTAVESDDVAAYARIDNDWERVAGDENPTDVDSDGEFLLELTASSPLNIADNYRIAVVNEEALNNSGQFPDGLTNEEFGDLDTETTFSLRTVEGDLTAQLSSESIAADVGDEVTLSGTALGQGDRVRVYQIGPRGDVEFVSASIDEEEYEEDFGNFNNRGTYTFIVVGEGRDGSYGLPDGDDNTLGGELTGEETQQQIIEIITDEYSGAGVDDQLVELTLQAENPQLTIDDFTTDGQVAQGEVTVSGTSNREDETTVFIEVLGQNDNVVASTEAEVNGSTSEWETTIDMSDVETGTYSLRADDDESSAEIEFELVTDLSTPTETPAPETETEAPETDTPAPETETEMPETDTPAPETETTTSTSTPGFGAIVALVALIAAALLAVRRD
jgi:major cell surface glycoprotein (TIGR04216 family)